MYYFGKIHLPLLRGGWSCSQQSSIYVWISARQRKFSSPSSYRTSSCFEFFRIFQISYFFSWRLKPSALHETYFNIFGNLKEPVFDLLSLMLSCNKQTKKTPYLSYKQFFGFLVLLSLIFFNVLVGFCAEFFHSISSF